MTRDQQIEFIQPTVVTKLLGEAYFNYVAIFAIREKRLDSEVNKALSSTGAGRNGKCGATIEVYFPTSVDAILGTPGPDSYFELVFIVRTQNTYNQGAHGTGLSCEAIAERVISTFHQWYLGGVGGSFFPAATFREAIDTGQSSLQAQKVTLRLSVKADPLPKTGTPPPAVESGPLTFTLAVPASDPTATLYYTTDGSAPGPGNYGDVPSAGAGTSVVYTVPFTVAANTTIRWSAWAAGKLGSSENYITAVT
jgi:hypothetical protein